MEKDLENTTIQNTPDNIRLRLECLDRAIATMSIRDLTVTKTIEELAEGYYQYIKNGTVK